MPCKLRVALFNRFVDVRSLCLRLLDRASSSWTFFLLGVLGTFALFVVEAFGFAVVPSEAALARFFEAPSAESRLRCCTGQQPQEHESSS